MLRIDYCLFFLLGSLFRTGLPWRARIWGGGESPRLLRDRPSDGATMAATNACGYFWGHCGQVMEEVRLLCADCGGDLGDHSRSKIMRNTMPLRAAKW